MDTFEINTAFLVSPLRGLCHLKVQNGEGGGGGVANLGTP